MKTMLVVSLFTMFAVPAFAQNQAAIARTAAGCGADNVKFDVKTDKSQHPLGQVPADKALVYVIEQEQTDAQAFKIGAVTIRIGLDGQWVGANHGNTYFYFLVDPGDHSLCANWQSSIGRFSKQAAAVSLSAEAGQVYYLLTKVDEQSHDNPAVWMEPLDPAEAKLLMASASLSSFHPRNSAVAKSSGDRDHRVTWFPDSFERYSQDGDWRAPARGLIGRSISHFRIFGRPGCGRIRSWLRGKRGI